MKLATGKDFVSPYQCPVTAMMQKVGGRWKLIILWCVRNGVQRFGAMQRAIPSISKKVLTAELRALEDDGFLTRTVFPEVPPRVEYGLTDLGKSLEDSLKVLAAWGEKYALTEPGANAARKGNPFARAGTHRKQTDAHRPGRTGRSR